MMMANQRWTVAAALVAKRPDLSISAPWHSSFPLFGKFRQWVIRPMKTASLIEFPC